jgi:hypothetical protein
MSKTPAAKAKQASRKAYKSFNKQEENLIPTVFAEPAIWVASCKPVGAPKRAPKASVSVQSL